MFCNTVHFLFSLLFSFSPLVVAIRSHQQSLHSNDVTMTSNDSLLSGTPGTRTTRRTQPMTRTYTYWLNTGDNNNHINANFMRSTYAATCRSRISRSAERCPRACRGIFVCFPAYI